MGIWVLGSFSIERRRTVEGAALPPLLSSSPGREDGKGGGNEVLRMWLRACRKEIIHTYIYLCIFSPARGDGSSGCMGNTQHRDGCEET